MNDILRDRLMRKLDLLPDDKLGQILDYIDFLETKYAPRMAPAPNPLRRFAEGVEGTFRAGKVSANAIAGTMSIMNKAVGAINEVAAAGKSVATGLMDAASGTPVPPSPSVASSAPGVPAPGAPAATPPVVATPPSIPRGGPHELGSQLPHPTGEHGK